MVIAIAIIIIKLVAMVEVLVKAKSIVVRNHLSTLSGQRSKGPETFQV